MAPKMGLHTGDFGITVLRPPSDVVRPGISMDLRIRFYDNGNETTLTEVEGRRHQDSKEMYYKEVFIKDMYPEMEIGELRRRLVEQERLEDMGHFRICLPPWEMPDRALLSQCYYQLMGYGMERWPPRFIIKNALKGFELTIEVPKSRATASFDIETAKFLAGPSGPGGVPADRPFCTDLCMISLTYDVFSTTTIGAVKQMIEKSIRIPADRHLLTCDMTCMGRVPMDDDSKTLADYDLKARSVVYFSKNYFDKDGKYIFDDAFFDHEAFHPTPEWSAMPETVSTQWRPDQVETPSLDARGYVHDERHDGGSVAALVAHHQG